MRSVAALSANFLMSKHVNPSVEFAKNSKSSSFRTWFTCSKNFSSSFKRAALLGSLQYTRFGNCLIILWEIFHGYSLFDRLEMYCSSRSQHKYIFELLLNDAHFLLKRVDSIPYTIIQQCVLNEYSIWKSNTLPWKCKVSISSMKRMEGFFSMASSNALLMTLWMSESKLYLQIGDFWGTRENIG